MSPARSRSDNPFEGDHLADPSVEKPLSALKALAGSEFEVLGPLGRDAQGEYAFLARELSRDRLVVLKQQRPGSGKAGGLQVITQLDSSVPPPAGSCPVCQAPFVNWEPSCPECGGNVAGGGGTALGTSPERALAAVREAAEGYEVLGTMSRAIGGATVYFAREPSGGHLVALRLEQDSITATRMMRPKLLYGAVGGEASRHSGVESSGPGLWTPIPSPPIPMRAAGNIGGVGGGEKFCPQCNQTFGSELRLCPRDGTALRLREVPDGLIGRVIAERYNIVGKLGQGGMGTVYLAEHVRMGRRCAVKVMNSILLNDPDSLDRFTREAKNASLLNHPHVAAIYDFGETADGIVYLAMEFVEGESLAAVLNRNHGLPEQQALELGSQVADALGAAHELGIVHRDLKPDNIMVCYSKAGNLRVKVVDFGIAKATQGGSQTVTRTGYVVGTPAYMSPEQILGDPLDGRSDLYSLGCILFEMLTGQRAFTGPSGEVSTRRRLTEPPPRPRTVKQALSKSLDEIVTRAMARAPEQRFQSAGQLRSALLAVLNERPRRAKWHGWLPWGHPQASREVEETPVIARTPDVVPRGALISPPPFMAASHLDTPADLPTPTDWADSVPPTTRLRHRSARSEGSHTGRLVGALVGVTLIGAAAVYVITSVDLTGYRLNVSEFFRSAPPLNDSTPIALSPSEPIPLPEDTVRAGTAPDTPGDSPVEPAPAMIRFTKPLPADARVTVDSNGARPAGEGLLTVASGSHTLTIRAPGFRKVTRTVTAIAGDTTGLDVELVRIPPKAVPPTGALSDSAMGAIVVGGSLPPGAVLRVDGRVVAPGSKVLTVTPGSHWVAVTVPGYATDSSRIDVEQGSWSDWSVPTLVSSPNEPQAIDLDTTLPSAPEVPAATADPAADSTPDAR
jgi:serine/threonine protein kinase